MIWYHTRVSTSRRSCFTITANDLVSHKGQHEQTVLLHHYSQRSGITQGSARADSLASPLQPMIWYHTRVSTSRQSCFTITANDLVSHKGQHEQTVLLHPLQPKILLHHYTGISMSRQSCFTITANDLESHKGQSLTITTKDLVSEADGLYFTITANDLVSHKGQHEQTVLLHHYSQRSGITQGSARADSLASPLQPMIWYHTSVSTSRQSCFTITANDLVSHKGQHEQTVLLHHYSQ